MNVKIVNSNKSTYWYADKIGETFEVELSFEWSCEEKYRVIGMYPISYIDFSDCEVVEN
ncbi:MAG: hypothetical protein WC677_07570 [Clostridia bacterium]|jgi:hypothetical protein